MAKTDTDWLTLFEVLPPVAHLLATILSRWLRSPVSWCDVFEAAISIEAAMAALDIDDEARRREAISALLASAHQHGWEISRAEAATAIELAHLARRYRDATR